MQAVTLSRHFMTSRSFETAANLIASSHEIEQRLVDGGIQRRFAQEFVGILACLAVAGSSSASTVARTLRCHRSEVHDRLAKGLHGPGQANEDYMKSVMAWKLADNFLEFIEAEGGQIND